MKILLYLLYILEQFNINSIHHCTENNRSTYLIPSSKYCIPDYDLGGDRYYFGPCTDNFDCFVHEKECMFAKGREDYCIGRDAHLCAFVDQGDFENYFLVECG